jgi:hypothetical protein
MELGIPLMMFIRFCYRLELPSEGYINSLQTVILHLNVLMVVYVAKFPDQAHGLKAAIVDLAHPAHETRRSIEITDETLHGNKYPNHSQAT